MTKKKIRVLSLNTWKNEADIETRKKLIAKGLREINPDVVVLQECFLCEETEEDTAKYLAGELGYKLHYAPARRKLRWHEGKEVDSYSGLAILSRFSFRDSWMLRLPSSEVSGERIALACEVNVGDFRMGVACIHFSHVRGEKEIREAQIDSTLKSLDFLSRRIPCILGGDFNCSSDSEEVIAVTGNYRRVINALPELGINEPTNPIPSREDREGRQIDQIWVLEREYSSRMEDLEVLDGGVCFSDIDDEFGMTPSDHAGVWVDLGISRR